MTENMTKVDDDISDCLLCLPMIDRYIFSNRNINKKYNSVTRSLDSHYCLSSPRTHLSPVKRVDLH